MLGVFDSVMPGVCVRFWGLYNFRIYWNDFVLSLCVLKYECNELCVCLLFVCLCIFSVTSRGLTDWFSCVSVCLFILYASFSWFKISVTQCYKISCTFYSVIAYIFYDGSPKSKRTISISWIFSTSAYYQF